MKGRLISIIGAAALLVPCLCRAAQPGREALDTACDSLTVWMQQRTGVKSHIKIKSVRMRGSSLDLTFTKTMSDYPWSKEDISWARDILSEAVPSEYSLGDLTCQGVNINEYPVKITVEDPYKSRLLVERKGASRYKKGLDGRYIALWQSHGRYFDADEGIWKWQRAPVHRTIEDMLTQSFVLPFLIPMLENAGAYVMTPRERDTQTREIIIDNDPSFEGTRSPGVRTRGSYSETGLWEYAGIGFADKKAVYSRTDNPFQMGSVRQTECPGPNPTATARWSFKVKERGRYAVYVSYRSIPQASRKAHYFVHHLGGTDEFFVDQSRGGSTWIYLGSFEFSEEGAVSLSNEGEKGYYVTADAVKIGGGMGKVDRGGGISGVPSYCEGAMYNMQWSGMDSEVWCSHDTDYTNDFASRGPWVKELKDNYGIPFDLSLAFHTDAGVASGDSIVGTLSIYTLKAEGKRKNSDGLDRMTGRRLAQTVQDQVTNDIRQEFNAEWTRRELWDRSYSECRTNDVPAMILELLSHQNFADMKYGHDPAFKFCVSRAVYKGVLRFLSELYGRPYVVQPLPVKDFSVVSSGEGKAFLSWEPTEDRLESSAVPSGYTVYTRIDDGAFDGGRNVSGTSVELPITKDHIFSFRVEAWNEGGRSFPSETLCIGQPSVPAGDEVLIVNNFTRVSAPSSIDSPTIAGFDGREDSGVPYIEDLSYVGQVYDFNRDHEWINDFESGFGASYTDRATHKVAGNTFDYPVLHARVLMELGLPFSSRSVGAFVPDSLLCPSVIDLICGKQTDVFPEALRSTIQYYTGKGCSLLVAGANIAAPFRNDSTRFASDVLGFQWVSSHGSPDGKVIASQNRNAGSPVMKIYREPNPYSYCVENPDALGTRSGSAALASGSVVMRYQCNMSPAAVHFIGKGYKVASYGFPLECLEDRQDFRKVLRDAMEFLRK